MRKLAFVTKPNANGIKRAILHSTEDGTFLYLSRSTEDVGADSDEWFETEDAALEAALAAYGLQRSAWTPISDIHTDCQADFVAPVRVKGKNIADPKFGHYERYEAGKWSDFVPNKPIEH